MTRKASELNNQELVEHAHGYAISARKSLDRGNTTGAKQTLGRVISYLERVHPWLKH